MFDVTIPPDRFLCDHGEGDYHFPSYPCSLAIRTEKGPVGPDGMNFGVVWDPKKPHRHPTPMCTCAECMRYWPQWPEWKWGV